MVFSIVIAGVLLLMGVFSIRRQLDRLRRLRSEPPLPSEDRAYLRNLAYRRLFTGVLMIGLAGMFAGSCLIDMDRRLEQIGQKNAPRNGEPAVPIQEERDFARFSLIYWIGILVLLFMIVSLSIVDLWATRRYAWGELRRIQSENQAMLERDLALYRQQKINDRMRNFQ